jgi:hypothetical protein
MYTMGREEDDMVHLEKESGRRCLGLQHMAAQDFMWVRESTVSTKSTLKCVFRKALRKSLKASSGEDPNLDNGHVSSVLSHEGLLSISQPVHIWY